MDFPVTLGAFGSISKSGDASPEVRNDRNLNPAIVTTSGYGFSACGEKGNE